MTWLGFSLEEGLQQKDLISVKTNSRTTGLKKTNFHKSSGADFQTLTPTVTAGVCNTAKHLMVCTIKLPAMLPPIQHQ